MNPIIEGKKAQAKFLAALLSKKAVNWRGIRLKLRHLQNGYRVASADWDTGIFIDPVRTPRMAWAAFIQSMKEQENIQKEINAGLDCAMRKKMEEIRSYGIDPNSVSQYTLFGKFNVEFPWKYTPDENNPIP